MLDFNSVTSGFEGENRQLLRNFLNRTYFNSWKYKKIPKEKEGFLANYRSLELQLNGKCDLECKYCYQRKFSDIYYDHGDADRDEKILHNCELILNMIEDNGFYPVLEIFSGDPLMQDIGYKVIDLILKRVESGKDNYTALTIPTNMSFLNDCEKVLQVESLLSRARKANFRIGLSASVDGPFMDTNRPSKDPDFKRGEIFYANLFQFMKKWGVGLHPMVYSEHIEKWIDNFNWFQDRLKEYDLPWYSIYLLEVRNVEWSPEQCQHLYNFTKYLVHWLHNKVNKSFDGWREAMKYNHLFNMINSPFSQIGRGLGCSVQSSLQIRTGDLSVFPCHRQMYPQFKAFQFVVENDVIVDVKPENIENYLMIQSTTSKNQPGCEDCVIREFCSGCCPGSAYEATGDTFSPVPTVCRAELYKLKGIVDGMTEVGILGNMMDLINERKRESLRMLIQKGIV